MFLSDKNIHDDITTTIGNTPLIRLNKITKGFTGSVLVKLEFMNPGSSVKDRVALNMIKDALSKNKINENTVLIEPTSGNTGIGLAMIAAAFGIKLVLTMPETMSIERRKLLKAYGAELVLTSDSAGMTGAVEKAIELAKVNANYLLLQQFENDANSDVHRQTTAEEIWRDTEGEIDILIAGVGTGGTITGVSEVIKKRKPFFKVIAVEPSSSPMLSEGISGPHKIQGIGAGFIPKILNREIIDEVITITDSEAGNAARNIAKQEGILVGISGGAAVAAALKTIQNPDNEGKMIVVVIPSNGERYLSTWLYEDIT